VRDAPGQPTPYGDYREVVRPTCLGHCCDGAWRYVDITCWVQSANPSEIIEFQKLDQKITHKSC